MALATPAWRGLQTLPLFFLVASPTGCTWAVRAAVGEGTDRVRTES